MRCAPAVVLLLLADMACTSGNAPSVDGRAATSDAADFGVRLDAPEADADDDRGEAASAIGMDVGTHPDAVTDAPGPGGADAEQTSLEAGVDGAGGSEAGAPLEFFVSPEAGDDDAPGTLAKPFHTIQRARDVIRLLGATGRRGPIAVYLRGGRHVLTSTLELGSVDSGTAAAPITYAAYAAESPVLSGGILVGGWSKDAEGRWVAALPPGLQFRQLYVGGRRAQRARGPAPTLTGSWGATDVWPSPPPAGYFTTDMQLAGWRSPADIELGYYDAWSHRICSLAGIASHDAQQLALTMKQPCFFFGLRVGGSPIDLDPLQPPDYMENALELLDEPGEWYHDRSTELLYYAPRPGESLDATEVIAPVLERLLEVRGSLDAPVHDLAFRGITFAHATWLRPSTEYGHIDIQANFTPDPEPEHGFWQDNGRLAMVHNQALKSPGAVLVSAGYSIEFERCSFTQLGGAGLDLANGAHANSIIGSRFFDLSGTGIQVGDVLEQDHHPSDPRWIVKDNVIANNYLHDLGLEFQGSIGVFVGYTDGTVIEHNEIANLPYTGVSLGWGWGDEDVGGGRPPTQPVLYTTPTIAANNRIEHNHIHHVMQLRADGGGIYTLGVQPNTLIRANYVHDSPAANGIYLDEGSGAIQVAENLVHDVLLSIALNNYYLGHNETCSIHDNYLDQEPAIDGVTARIARDAGIQTAYQDILAR